MPVAYLTRIVGFSATHRISRADWTPEQNRETFSRAAQDHAHEYRCEVTVKGPLEAGRGGVVNLGALDALLTREITERFHGRHINEAIPEFAPGGRLATGEALTVYVWERLVGALPAGVTLHRVRVQEGPNLYSEYFGEA
jgi:6-pyruvoyltetrahydropterin/6-carboxytetrahydropterin synthase